MPGKAESTTADHTNTKSTYVGSVSGLSTEAMLSMGPENNCSTTPTVRLFLAKYRAYPCLTHAFGDDGTALLHATTIIEYISNELKHDLADDCITRHYYRPIKQYYQLSRLSDLGNGIMIDMMNGCFYSVCLFHSFLFRQDALHSIFDPRDHRQDVDLRSTGHGKGDLVARVLALSHAIPRLSSDHRRRREHHQGSKRDADPVSGRRQSSQLVSSNPSDWIAL